MKVLVLSDRWSTRGGADQHLRQVVEWAVLQGWRTVVAYGWGDSTDSVPAGVSAVRVRGLSSKVDSEARLGKLEPLLAEADVVHVHNVMNPFVLRAARQTGRVIVTIQDHRHFCPGQGKTLPDGRRCNIPFEDADCSECLREESYRQKTITLTKARRDAVDGAQLVVLSRFMKQELHAVGLKDVHRIPPWFETGPRRVDPGRAFLMGGRLVAHKGMGAGYRAWREADCSLPLRIAGEGPLGDTFRDCTKLGWLDSDALKHELRNARALLFPSEWQEPFGMLAVEALAQGCPVISTNVGGVGDWADTGTLRVPASDPAALSDAIRSLACDPDRALELGDEGRRMVAHRFSQRFVGEKLLGLYGEVATKEV